MAQSSVPKDPSLTLEDPKTLDTNTGQKHLNSRLPAGLTVSPQPWFPVPPTGPLLPLPSLVVKGLERDGEEERQEDVLAKQDPPHKPLCAGPVAGAHHSIHGLLVVLQGQDLRKEGQDGAGEGRSVKCRDKPPGMFATDADSPRPPDHPLSSTVWAVRTVEQKYGPNQIHAPSPRMPFKRNKKHVVNGNMCKWFIVKLSWFPAHRVKTRPPADCS